MSPAISAAAGFVGGQVGQAAGAYVGSAAAGAAVGAAAGYVTSVELSKAAGYDVHFSLREMGASAATAYAGSLISQGITGTAESSSTYGNRATARAQPFMWSAVARGAVADVLTSAAGYGIRKGFGLEAHWNWSEVAADAFGNALGNAAVAGIQRWQANRAASKTPNSEQIEAGQRILGESTASLSGGGGKTDPLDFLRQSDDFQSALDKLGSDAKVLYDTEVWSIAENAKNGMGMTLDAGSGRFGSNRVALSADETSALSKFLELSGAVTYDEDGSVGASMALVARKGATVDQVNATIKDTLGRFVTDWDTRDLTQNLSVRNGVVTSTGALNLIPLQDTVIERFNISVFGSPSALAAAQRYEDASVKLINPYRENTKTYKQQALDDYQRITGSIRDRLIDNGYLPKRIAYSERMTGVYQVIGDMMLGVIPAERLLAPLLKPILGVARGLLPQVAANSVTGRVMATYQRFYNEEVGATMKAIELGRLRVPKGLNSTTFAGNRADAAVTDRMKIWVQEQGLSKEVLLNRRITDPAGLGKVRRPDIRIPSENTIIDGTIGIKTLQTPQIKDFIRYIQGNTVIIVRPNELPTLLYAGGRP